jgi:hypothetical protein
MGNSLCTDAEFERSEEARFDKQFQAVAPFCCRRVAAFPLTQMAQYEINKSRQESGSHSPLNLSPLNSLPKRLSSRNHSSKSDNLETKIFLYPIKETPLEKGTPQMEENRQAPDEEACQDLEENLKGKDNQYGSQNTIKSTQEDENSDRAVIPMLEDDTMDCVDAGLKSSVISGLS